MQTSKKRRGLSGLGRSKYFWIIIAFVAVALMTALAFGIAAHGSSRSQEAEEIVSAETPAPLPGFNELYEKWESSKGSWEASLKHKYTEPVSVAVKTKSFSGGISRESWYVTTNEYTDRAGNLRTIFNFCAYDWAGVRQWLVEHESPDWPYGGVKDAYLAKNWGKPVAMAIAACTLRECAGVADQLQYMQRAGTLHGSFGVEVSNAYVFTCLEKREYDQGYGLIGWTFDALDDFIAFCKASSLNPRSLETQLYFMAYQYYASQMWHQRYTYLFSYETAEPTLENIQTIARIHTSCVGMGSVPSVVYPSPTNDVQRILANWGNKTFPDLTAAASGAYAFLYQTAYNQQPDPSDADGIAESSMFSGEEGTTGPTAETAENQPSTESGSSTPALHVGGSSSSGGSSGGGSTAKPQSKPSQGGSTTQSQTPAENPGGNSQPAAPSGGGDSGSSGGGGGGGGSSEPAPAPSGGGDSGGGSDIYTVTGPNILE